MEDGHLILAIRSSGRACVFVVIFSHTPHRNFDAFAEKGSHELQARRICD